MILPVLTSYVLVMFLVGEKDLSMGRNKLSFSDDRNLINVSKKRILMGQGNKYLPLSASL